MRTLALTLGVLLLTGVASLAEAPQTVALPKPQTDGGKPLMQALKARHSSRAFAPDKLPDQVLSNLLWAAAGVNRPDGRRTAPTAVNAQEIDVYVATADGLFLYDAKGHALQRLLADDLRPYTGMQDFVRDAPLNLIFVADFSKMRRIGREADRDLYAATDTGFVSQNVYLFCASEGLNTVVRGMVDRNTLGPKMNLRPEQKIILAQTVGYPPK